MENTRLSVECGQCAHPLSEFLDHEAQNAPCPKCKSTKRHIRVEIREESALEIKEFIDLKLKADAFPSKAKLRMHIQQGDELHRKSGTWMKKERVIDKDSNSYKEVIIDPATNEVVRHCEEPLSDHVNRGSARPK